MIFKSFVSACAIVALSAGIASAAPVSLKKTNPCDTFDGGGRKALRIINDSDPSVNLRVLAGGFRLTDETNGADIIAWCLDIAHTLNLKGLYQITTAPFSNTFTPAQKNLIENLFETSYLGVDLNNNHQSAGFQLALWELVYEGSGDLDVKDGTFRSTTDTAARDIANGYLANLGGAVTQSYDVAFYESLGWEKNGETHYSQNLVSVTPVPLPAAGLLLVCGLAGVCAVSRRKQV